MMETKRTLNEFKTRLSGTLLFLILPTFAFAQDSGVGEKLDVNVDIGKNTSNLSNTAWYSSPWIWVGIAAFVVILVLAMRGGSGKQT